MGLIDYHSQKALFLCSFTPCLLNISCVSGSPLSTGGEKLCKALGPTFKSGGIQYVNSHDRGKYNAPWEQVAHMREFNNGFTKEMIWNCILKEMSGSLTEK